MGTPDVQSAAIGSGAVHDGKGHVYLGTSSWITCHVSFKKTDLFRNMASLPSALPGRYLVANAQETAGACVRWLRDSVLFGNDALGDHAPPDDFFERLEALAGAAPVGSDKLIFTPWLIGERSPVADATVRGAFFNQQLSTTRSHLARAVLEGVAYNTRWLLGAVERFVGGPMSSLRAIGGGASSPLWCQILADVLDREIAQVENPVQCNARGAGLLGALGLGRIRLDDIPERVAIARRFQPRREHRRAYDELFSAYLDLYRATKGIFAKLNAQS
jgi:xylulokinase